MLKLLSIWTKCKMHHQIRIDSRLDYMYESDAVLAFTRFGGLMLTANQQSIVNSSTYLLASAAHHAR